MTTPTTAELIALLEHADRTMTPGEWFWDSYTRVLCLPMVRQHQKWCEDNRLHEIVPDSPEWDAVDWNKLATEEPRVAVANVPKQTGRDDAAGIATLRNNAAAIARELARLSEENRKLREMFDLATSIHTMTDEQLQQLIANCKAAKEMK